MNFLANPVASVGHLLPGEPGFSAVEDLLCMARFLLNFFNSSGNVTAASLLADIVSTIIFLKDFISFQRGGREGEGEEEKHQ